MSNSNAATEAIASAFNPILDKKFETAQLITTTQFLELKLEISGLKLQLDSIEAAVVNKKKTITKKTATVEEGAVAEQAAKETVTKAKPVNVNKYFNEQFKKEEFRSRVQTEELKKTLEVNPMVISKPTAAQKSTLIAKLTLEDIKLNNKTLYAEIEAEATAAANKGATEQVVEDHTPVKK